MSIIDVFLSKLAPFECLGCGSEGELACPNCLKEYLINKEECYRCRQVSNGCLTCSSCTAESPLYRARAVVTYKGLAKDLIWRLKSSGARSVSRTMSAHMAPLMPKEISLIVPIPTASSRIRQRGYDQSRLLARQLSKISGIPWADCLVRTNQAHQVGSDKTVRLSQLEGAFRPTNSHLFKGRQVLVLDDVITTGASVELAAAILKNSGALKVEALAFARPGLLK